VLNNRIAIGAAQFGGFPYGVSNDGSTKVSYAEISNILTYAKSVGVNTIDTAITYGVSETRLGNFDVSNNDVITKLPEISKNCHDISSWVEKNLEDSLVRLKLPKVYGLLVWNINDLFGSRGLELWTAMQSLKKKKLVHKIGYSVYACIDHSQIIIDDYFSLLDPVFSKIQECENGRDITSLLESPVSHSTFKRLN